MSLKTKKYDRKKGKYDIINPLSKNIFSILLENEKVSIGF